MRSVTCPSVNMASECFTEALHRLKEIHDKEVLGMQTKLTELTMEKCRDSQRIEELFSKNHILREQHKVLNENIKVLENRLRAGLCDRCTVTQEIAKKKQQEYENCHFHNLQQISSLTNEINLLKEENKTLLDELRKIKSMEINSSEKSISRSLTPENNVIAEAQQPGLSTTNPKNTAEKASKDRETPEMIPERQAPEGAAVLRLSPAVKHMQGLEDEARQGDMNMSGVQKLFLSTHKQQRISNQLHGTIAVMRPGAKSGPNVEPSSIHKRSPNHELNSKELPVETCSSPFPLEPLKHVLSEEQFSLLKQHYVIKHLAQHAPGLQNEGAPHKILDKHRQTPLERRRPEDNWEEKVTMAELQGAVLYVREQGLKNRINQVTQREKLHYLLTKQTQGLRIPNSRVDVPKSLRESQEDKEMSLIQALRGNWANSRQINSQEMAQDWEEKDAKYAEAETRAEEQEESPDKPLDLSDTRRSQCTYQNDIKKQQRHSYEGCIQSQTSGNNTSPTIKASNSDCINGSGPEDTMEDRGTNEKDAEENTKDKVIDYNLVSQLDRELSTAKILTKGHKRYLDSDEDEEQIRDVKSPQEMDEGSATSDTEGEIEKSEQASTDSCHSEKKANKQQWKKRLPKASKKSLRKKKKVRDHSTESDTSEENNKNDLPE
ncbi:hypothetical protein GDO81_013459 [Engystomops pustulosus]|uniref:DNA endonuclease Ctp1 N-terminal domain-containing protein n=1 Tax=Engystomops pustulosus TaxID=76066 RepID=A0AAV7B424_ENGPU|nr:hypothetical protein GDO81_013459 [Engystomops pustulosus]